MAKKLLLKLLVASTLLYLCYRGANYAYYNIFVPEHYEEIDYPTPNIGEGKNEVWAIVLHHTAGESLLGDLTQLTNKELEVSCHALIARNGTRYLLAQPEQITWHAGRSSLHGRTDLNKLAVGIEFEGNTIEQRLTQRQVLSAIEYIRPIVKKYHIPIENIVTHEMVRKEWIESQQDTTCLTKSDITQQEYRRFLKEYKKNLSKK